MATQSRQQSFVRGESEVILALDQKEARGQVGIRPYVPVAPCIYLYLGPSHYTELVCFSFL